MKNFQARIRKITSESTLENTLKQNRKPQIFATEIFKVI